MCRGATTAALVGAQFAPVDLQLSANNEIECVVSKAVYLSSLFILRYSTGSDLFVVKDSKEQ